MKITIYCMNEAGHIVGGIVTSDTAAAAYMQRKQAAGLITIKRVAA